MHWRSRFEALVDELDSTPGIRIVRAEIGPPTSPHVLAAAREVAGAAWPAEMTELYAELSQVAITYEVAGSGGNGGAIHIPVVTDVWDHAGHEDELWFDWLVDEEPAHPFTRIRPIDRFTEEAYAVLYPVPADGPAMVCLHVCGETLWPTGLTYAAWLELLLRARGAAYWLSLTTGPRPRRTWVDENLDRVAALFPSFAPAALVPVRPRPAIFGG
ncbi:MAG: hypothetical protein NT062_32400 [Proteobacteria bacterium]|nr:hypothetical protein [Pseudomonadota bacterium]